MATHSPSSFALAALAVLALSTASACCQLDGTCNQVPDAGPPVHDVGTGEVKFASDGCDPASIVDNADGTVCASCTDTADGSVAQICGTPDSARCESRENAAGTSCSVCTDSANEILFDSCYGADPVPSASCEQSPDSGKTGALTGGGDVVCESCTDASGVVVSSSCEPPSDECHQTTDQGLTCRECTKGGDVVVHDCSAPDIQPRSCEAYNNDAGRCVDCFGSDDALLSHDCTLTSNTNIACTEVVSQDGLDCTTCTDGNGSLVEHKCDGAQPTAQQCTRLDYTEQTCVVCVDDSGAPAAWSCEQTGCTDPTTCDKPPECVFDNSPDGALCRTCPVGNAGETEQRCVGTTNVACSYYGADPTVNDGTCVTCVDDVTGVEVYNRCDGGGSPPPPACTDEVNDQGTTCQVCVDQSTQQTVSSTCEDQTCYAAGQFQVTGANGAGLFVDNAPAVATCEACAAAQNGVAASTASVNGVCSLRNDCAVDLSDPVAYCAATIVFTVLPKACNNPWELSGFDGSSAGGADEMVRVLGFALEQRNIALVGVDDVGRVADSSTCANGCGCPRGDRLEIAADPADAVAVAALFDGVLEKCAADADCATGGSCRSDGACTAPGPAP